MQIWRKQIFMRWVHFVLRCWHIIVLVWTIVLLFEREYLFSLWVLLLKKGFPAVMLVEKHLSLDLCWMKKYYFCTSVVLVWQVFVFGRIEFYDGVGCESIGCIIWCTVYRVCYKSIFCLLVGTKAFVFPAVCCNEWKSIAYTLFRGGRIFC